MRKRMSESETTVQSGRGFWRDKALWRSRWLRSGGFLCRKGARLLLLLLGVSAAAFFLVSLSPVDPLQTNVGQAALGSMSQEQIARLRSYWGADTPPLQGYAAWLRGALSGDLGTSLLYRRPVLSVMGEKLKNSLWLTAAAWLLSGAGGFALGTLAGAKQGTRADRVITGAALLLSGTPAFFLALLLLSVFSVQLGWLPVGLSVPIGMAAEQVGMGHRLVHAVLPGLCLSLSGMPNILLQVREKMLQVMESDFVLFAQARGDSWRAVAVRHGLRNVALPALTLQFASVGEILGGSVLVEQVFSYPGLGQAAVTAGLGGDVPLLLGITVASASLVFCGNLMADVLYGIVDPRMRKAGGLL